MSRFNLIEENWIKVIINEKGETEKVSLKDFFRNAHNYLDFGGESKAQDFAVMRVILAILHTVFSRVDSKGEVYEALELDERMRPLNEVDEDDLEDYNLVLEDTWVDLWENGKFSQVIEKYLDKWHDRFYLFDEEYPFYQVNKKFMEEEKPNLVKKGSTAGRIYGKDINRLIRESSNKISLFSPRSPKYKEILTKDEITRWLITYQAYTGTAEKQTFRKKETSETWSKGWVYDLGGIYLSGENLFRTLMLNLVMVHPDVDFQGKIQKPVWETDGKDRVEKYLYPFQVDNLAELYTNWSRAIYIDSELDLEKGFKCIPIKLIEVNHLNQFLEPMTMFRYNEVGPNKDYFTPRKHQYNKALWRSFGLVTLPNGKEQIKPRVMEWLEELEENEFIGDRLVNINAISMEADGNAMSWTPVNEIYDQLIIDEKVLTDLEETGWIPRIYEVVEDTKEVVEKIYGSFLNNIERIRFGRVQGDLVSREKEELYFMIDEPFRHWLAEIRIEDDMDDKVKDWNLELKDIAMKKARDLLKNANSRDLKGIEVDEKLLNVPIAFNWFSSRLNKKLEKSD